MRSRAGRRTGPNTGLFLVGQLLLAVAAVIWGPIGSRDAAEVSEILPALHPVIEERSTASSSIARSTDDSTPGPASRHASAAAAPAVPARVPTTSADPAAPVPSAADDLPPPPTLRLVASRAPPRPR